jgi:transposase
MIDQEERRLYRVRLTEEQRDELKRRSHAPGVMPRTRDRLEMVRLSDAGWSIPQIARHLQSSEKRVRFWIKRFLDAGFAGLPDQPHLGQSSRLTPELLEAIRTELRKGDRTWTAAQLAEWLRLQHGLDLTPGWLAELLKRARITYKRTNRGLQHKQDAARVAAAQAELAELEKGARQVGWTSGISTRPASPRRCR